MASAAAAPCSNVLISAPAMTDPSEDVVVVALMSNAASLVDASRRVPMMLSGTIGTRTHTTSVPKRARRSRNPASSTSPIDNGRSCGVNVELGKVPPRIQIVGADQSAKRTTVLALIVRAVVAGADRFPPPAVVAVPAHRPLEPVGEPPLRLPAERPRLLGAEGVATVVAGPVGDVFDQRLVGARVFDDPLDDLEVRRLVRAADVVDLAGLAALEHGPDPAREVLDVDPVADFARGIGTVLE